MKRDFSSESLFNLALRAHRASAGRWRGFLYRALGMFHANSGANLVFGAGARFINSRSIYFGNSVHFGLLARLECFGKLTSASESKLSFGDGTSFGDYFHAGASNGIVIGRNVLGGSGILIIDHNHGEPKNDLAGIDVSDPKQRNLTSRGKIVIGDNVWIGDGAIILPGSYVGDGSIVAAKAIVRGDVPARSVYYGE